MTGHQSERGSVEVGKMVPLFECSCYSESARVKRKNHVMSSFMVYSHGV